MLIKTLQSKAEDHWSFALPSSPASIYGCFTSFFFHEPLLVMEIDQKSKKLTVFTSYDACKEMRVKDPLLSKSEGISQ